MAHVTPYRVEILRRGHPTAPAGQFWWRVRSKNGRIVSWSGETYAHKSHTLKMAEQLFPTFPIELAPSARNGR